MPDNLNHSFAYKRGYNRNKLQEIVVIVTVVVAITDYETNPHLACTTNALKCFKGSFFYFADIRKRNKREFL